MTFLDIISWILITMSGSILAIYVVRLSDYLQVKYNDYKISSSDAIARNAKLNESGLAIQAEIERLLNAKPAMVKLYLTDRTKSINYFEAKLQSILNSKDQAITDMLVAELNKRTNS